MHELGIVMEVVRVVEDLAKEQDIQTVETIVLQIGELSGAVPQFIEACYPAAVDGSFMEDTKLEIEIIPGNARCLQCQTIFNVLKAEGHCTNCASKDFEVLSGKDFLIKEIRVPEE